MVLLVAGGGVLIWLVVDAIVHYEPLCMPSFTAECHRGLSGPVVTLEEQRGEFVGRGLLLIFLLGVPLVALGAWGGGLAIRELRRLRKR